MKTSIDIPESVLAEAMRYTKSKTKREAVVTVMEDFVRRRRMADLVQHSGKFTSLIALDEMKATERSRDDKLNRIGHK